MSAKQVLMRAAQAVALAAVVGGASAAPTTYTELVNGAGFGTGDLPASAQSAGSVSAGLTRIVGNLNDAAGASLPNLVDVFGFSLASATRLIIDTFGSAVADTQLFLFDAAGNGVGWNNDASITPANTQSELWATLAAGDYYVAITPFGLDPIDLLGGSLFDTLGNGGGPLAGAGALDSWLDFSGAQFFDLQAYNINFRVPTPGALPLTLLALGLAGAVAARRRA